MAKPTHIGGIELGGLPPQFEPAAPGRVLILDGDSAAYRAALSSGTLGTAINRYNTAVITEMLMTRADRAIVHLTAYDCVKLHRDKYPTQQKYQSSRKNKDKPPLLEPLREALGELGGIDGHDVSIILNRELEADDAMRSDAELLPDVVISSADKDLRQLTQPWYELSIDKIDYLSDPFGWIDIGHTPSGANKPLGHGHAFVLWQWLMGDTADTVRGLPTYQGKRVGLVRAHELIQKWGTLQECVHRILHAYAKVKVDALAEFEMLWLRRTPKDTGYAWLTSLGIEPRMQAWLDRLHARHKLLLKRNTPT